LQKRPIRTYAAASQRAEINLASRRIYFHKTTARSNFCISIRNPMRQEPTSRNESLSYSQGRDGEIREVANETGMIAPFEIRRGSCGQRVWVVRDRSKSNSPNKS
jgi:hypothetical protein